MSTEMLSYAKPAHVAGTRSFPLVKGVVGWAMFGGKDHRYRYELGRQWDTSKLACMFLMMNPSTAMEMVDDATVRKIQAYARAWGYGRVYVGNTFAYRATDQKRLLEDVDAVGPENDKYLLSMARRSEIVVLACGKPHKSLLYRGPQVTKMLREHGLGDKLHYLRRGADGMPHHPLYLPRDLKPTRWP